MDIFFPLQKLADWFSYSLIGLKAGTLAAKAVNFFIFDTLKIFILLAIIIFGVSILRSYLPPAKIKRMLARKNKYLGHILAALTGTITPFCSCSAIPLFVGFIEAGVPLGITISFLIASPMVNEIAVIMLFGLFGWRIALIYIISGLLIAIISGLIIGRLKTEALLLPFTDKPKEKGENENHLLWRKRLIEAKNYTLSLLKKIWIYVVIGVGLGAVIHGYAPADFLSLYAGADKWYAVPLAVIIGIPLYANAAGVVPLVGALSEKGVAMGTVLAFMMSVTALSLPEFMILKRVMENRLLLIFAGIVGLGILITGVLFNLILK